MQAITIGPSVELPKVERMKLKRNAMRVFLGSQLRVQVCECNDEETVVILTEEDAYRLKAGQQVTSKATFNSKFNVFLCTLILLSMFLMMKMYILKVTYVIRRL